VPPDERLWSDHDEKLSPVDPPREQGQGEASGVVQALRFDLPLDIAGQLLAQEQILSGEALVR
jgi:hypothetical protein